MNSTSYVDLVVWQKSFKLTQLVYMLSRQLPVEERYGLVSQMRRCAVSVPSNIAEGNQRNSRNEYRHFIGIAKGSAAELETQLMLVDALYGIPVESELALSLEVRKMLAALSKSLKSEP